MATAGSGRTLAAALHEHGFLPPNEVMRIIADAADALAAVHADGRHHGDIGLDTVRVSGDRVWLDEPVTGLPGASTGSASGQRESDVYALATVAYRCLGGDPATVLGRPGLDWPLPENVPEPIAQAVRRALGDQPRFRSLSASRFGRACRDALATPVSGDPVPSAGPTPAIGATMVSRRRTALIGVAAVVLVLVASVAVLWQPWGSDDDAVADGQPTTQDSSPGDGSPSRSDSGSPSGPTGSPDEQTAGVDPGADDGDPGGVPDSGDDEGDQPADGMPDVIGMNNADAADAVTAAGVSVVTQQYDQMSDAEQCTVVSQDPEPGTPITPYSGAVLVSSGDFNSCWTSGDYY